MKKELATELSKYIKEKKNQDECSGFIDGFKKAWEVMQESNGLEVDLKQNDGVLAICLVGHGYQIDVLDWKAYIDGEVKALGSECRDYGNDLDAEKFGAKIIEFIRKGED